MYEGELNLDSWTFNFSCFKPITIWVLVFKQLNQKSHTNEQARLEVRKWLLSCPTLTQMGIITT